MSVLVEGLKLPIFATPGTEMLQEFAISCTSVEKTHSYEGSAIELLDRGLIDLVINVPREYDSQGRPDGLAIRRCSVETGVPLFTDLQRARALVEHCVCAGQRVSGHCSFDKSRTLSGDALQAAATFGGKMDVQGQISNLRDGEGRERACLTVASDACGRERDTSVSANFGLPGRNLPGKVLICLILCGAGCGSNQTGRGHYPFSLLPPPPRGCPP